MRKIDAASKNLFTDNLSYQNFVLFLECYVFNAQFVRSWFCRAELNQLGSTEARNKYDLNWGIMPELNLIDLNRPYHGFLRHLDE